MQVSPRDFEVEFRNNLVPVQDAFSPKVSGGEVLHHSIELFRSNLAMVATLELRTLLGPRIRVFDGIFDLLAADFERSGNSSFGPFDVVVFTALDVA
jgi:hypothetical protein